jgi:microcystin-dependent protein
MINKNIIIVILLIVLVFLVNYNVLEPFQQFGDIDDLAVKGSPGSQGPQGPQGSSGASGVDGRVGNKGDIGLDGSPGPQGPQGVQGIKGLAGEQGPAGPKGEDGITEFKTEIGEKVVGPQGPRGLQGDLGPQGLRGEQGIQGLKGDPGQDGATGQNGNPGQDATAPRGLISMWSGSQPPSGWLLCNGQSFTKEDGSYEVIGGETRKTPDLRGRFVLGSGQGAGLTNRTLSSKGGEETHTLTVDEMPEHSHSYQKTKDAGNRRPHGNSYDLHNQIFENTTSTSTGGSEAHNNMPPYYVLAFVIKQ